MIHKQMTEGHMITKEKLKQNTCTNLFAYYGACRIALTLYLPPPYPYGEREIRHEEKMKEKKQHNLHADLHYNWCYRSVSRK